MVKGLMLVVFLGLFLSACATPPASTTGACAVLNPYMPIRASREDTEETKRQVLLANTAHKAACL